MLHLEELKLTNRWNQLPVSWWRATDVPDTRSVVAHLSDLLYLGASLPDERPTLAGGDDQPQGDWRLGADGAVGHQSSQVLRRGGGC